MNENRVNFKTLLCKPEPPSPPDGKAAIKKIPNLSAPSRRFGTNLFNHEHFLNEMARAILLTSCEETVKYPQ
jgi:hypothetical protein